MTIRCLLVLRARIGDGGATSHENAPRRGICGFSHQYADGVIVLAAFLLVVLAMAAVHSSPIAATSLWLARGAEMLSADDASVSSRIGSVFLADKIGGNPGLC